MPIAITIDKSKILCVVIFVINQVVEYHKTIHFPHFRHAMCQSCAYLKYVSVVYAWQTIVCPDKSGNAYNV